MKDLQERLDKLRMDAVDCDLIAKLATDDEKSNTFRLLAEQYRAMANEIETVIAHQIENQIRSLSRPPSASPRRTL